MSDAILNSSLINQEAPPTKMTVEEFRALYPNPIPGLIVELLDGKVMIKEENPMSDTVVLPPPSRIAEAAPPAQKITVAEFNLLYPDPLPGLIVELIDGEVMMKNTPSPQHQMISARLVAFLVTYVLNNNLGEVQHAPSGVYFDDYTTVQPDLFFVAREGSKCYIDADNMWHGAPDLCIEILSPSSAKTDRQAKFQLYERHGVREYWILSPSERLVEVYVWREGGYLRLGVYGEGDEIKGEALPGLALAVAGLFPVV